MYRDDGTSDHRGVGRCVECGTPASNKRHQLPDTSEANKVDARRIGEREEER